jgi:hypothetical protein
MPWHISKDGNKYKVVKDADGKVVGTHDSYAQATKQLAALHIHVKEKN